MGTAALTSRSFKEEDFVKVADFLHEALQIALKAQEKSNSKLLKDFVLALESDAASVASLKERVTEFAHGFPMPGFSPTDIDL